MNNASNGSRWNLGALRHSTSELWAMVSTASDLGIDAERCLVGTLLDLDTLCHRRSRISFAQQLEIQQRLELLPIGTAWAVKVGRRLHLTSYGMAGYALLSSETLEVALALAQRFEPLLNLKHELVRNVVGKSARIELRDGYAMQGDPRGVWEAVELLKLVNLLGDMLGTVFRPEEIVLSHRVDDSLAGAFREEVCCPVTTGGRSSEIRFDDRLLAMRLPQSDATTCGNCIEVCERQLVEALRFNMTAGRVRGLLESSISALPSMTEVAKQLCMSARSLRRRLEDESTSFHDIVDDIRKELALRLIATTDMSTESIADMIGYGDAANFRHAFKRWTGESPRPFRQRNSSTRRGSEFGTFHARTSSPATA